MTEIFNPERPAESRAKDIIMTEQAPEYATDVATINHAATGTTELVLDGAAFERIMQVAEWMASGRSTVPAHLQKNAADCGAVVIQAMQWHMNPYAVAQKTFLINGVLGYEAQLVNAVITSMAPTTGRLQYEWFGPWEKIIGKFREIESKKTDDTGRPKKYRVPAWTAADEEGLGIRIWATLKGEDEPRVLELLMTQARTRNSTLWADDPKQQIAYLATKRWARLYCPDVILGVYTPDELDETHAPRERDITPRKTATEYADEAAKATAVSPEDSERAISDLEIVAKESGEAALKAAWNGLTKEMRKAIGIKERDRLLRIANAEDAQPAESEAKPAVDPDTGEVTQGAAQEQPAKGEDDDNPFAGV